MLALRRDALEVNHEDFNEGIIAVQAKKKANLGYAVYSESGFVLLKGNIALRDGRPQSDDHPGILMPCHRWLGLLFARPWPGSTNMLWMHAQVLCLSDRWFCLAILASGSRGRHSASGVSTSAPNTKAQSLTLCHARASSATSRILVLCLHLHLLAPS